MQRRALGYGSARVNGVRERLWAARCGHTNGKTYTNNVIKGFTVFEDYVDPCYNPRGDYGSVLMSRGVRCVM